MKKLLLFGLALFSLLILPTDLRAEEIEIEETVYQGEIISIDSGNAQVRLSEKDLKGQVVEIDLSLSPDTIRDEYDVGDQVLVTRSPEISGEGFQYFITDFVRVNSLLYLFILFATLAILIGGKWGLSSLVGMAFSFGVIFVFILPRIIAGWNPVLVAVLGSALIIPVTFYFSHGINRKTNIAIAGTIISLIITGLLASIFVELTHLTGFSSDEAGFLNFEQQGQINMKGILLAGMIIGVLGILDDITVSQASIVTELREANSKLSNNEVFKRAMKVGKDHIASLVNTLVLVYAGASLPLLLLFINSPRPFSEVVNYEIIADEIVRTLVGSIGLVLAVPITTFIASHGVKFLRDISAKQ